METLLYFCFQQHHYNYNEEGCKNDLPNIIYANHKQGLKFQNFVRFTFVYGRYWIVVFHNFIE